MLNLILAAGAALRGAARVALARGTRSGARRVPRAALDLDRRHVAAGGGAEHGRAVRRPRAPVDPALRALRERAAPRALARVGAEVPDRRRRRLGDAAVRAGDDLRSDRRDRLRRDRQRAVERQPRDRPAHAHRHRAVRGRARLQGLRRALPPVDARRLRGRADADHGVHGGGDEGRRARRVPALLRRRADQRAEHVGPGAGGARDDHDPRRQRRRARAVLAEADARVLVGRAGRLHARRRRRGDAARRARDRLLPRRLPVHEHGRVRRDRRARARNGLRRLDPGPRRPRSRAPVAGVRR